MLGEVEALSQLSTLHRFSMRSFDFAQDDNTLSSYLRRSIVSWDDKLDWLFCKKYFSLIFSSFNVMLSEVEALVQLSIPNRFSMRSFDFAQEDKTFSSYLRRSIVSWDNKLKLLLCRKYFSPIFSLFNVMLSEVEALAQLSTLHRFSMRSFDFAQDDTKNL